MEAAEESQLTAQSPRVARRGERLLRWRLPWRLRWPAWLAPLDAAEASFEVNGDSLIYGGLAKNLLLHGRFALTLPSGKMYPTLIRLPGYPLFLALCFRLFGMENYFSAACVQIALDLLGCLLLAGFCAADCTRAGRAGAPRWRRSGWRRFAPLPPRIRLAPLTETPTLFVLALAMWAMARFRDEPGWANALWFTAR
jgi:hypothetical protein